MSPGARIRVLRIILGISREGFCKKHDINFNTLTSIEVDRLKISIKQYKKIVGAFQAEGIYVERAWLEDGKGPAPSRFLSHIQQDRSSFLEVWSRGFSNNKNAVSLQVNGDFMEPFYSSGDYVGGIWHNSPHMLLGKKCIVKFEREQHIGVLFQYKDFFSLAPANVNLHHAHIIFKINDIRITEVLWHIRRHSHQTPEVSLLSQGSTQRDLSS